MPTRKTRARTRAKSNNIVSQIEKLDEVGQRLWNHFAEVIDTERLHKSDAAALIGICVWYDLFWYWQERSKSKDSKEAYKANCMMGMAWKHIACGLSRFGLTPLDRLKFNKPTDENVDPFSDWLVRTNDN